MLSESDDTPAATFRPRFKAKRKPAANKRRLRDMDQDAADTQPAEISVGGASREGVADPRRLSRWARYSALGKLESKAVTGRSLDEDKNGAAADDEDLGSGRVDSGRMESRGTDAMRRDAMNMDTMNMDTTKVGTMNMDTIGGNTMNINSMNMDTTKVGTMNMDTMNMDTMNMDTMNTDSMRMKSMNTGAFNTETMNMDTIKEGTMNMDTIGVSTMNINSMNIDTTNLAPADLATPAAPLSFINSPPSAQNTFVLRHSHFRDTPVLVPLGPEYADRYGNVLDDDVPQVIDPAASDDDIALDAFGQPSPADHAPDLHDMYDLDISVDDVLRRADMPDIPGPAAVLSGLAEKVSLLEMSIRLRRERLLALAASLAELQDARQDALGAL
ncbi:hypothetical protein METBIDRAFT_199473 [Metschnikowia bicuspidata var. bicuspidata NRRL YB-4993]|uniref:Uncharacterized protein n=1 Tax=Metschnikowia bicuspidata var. bicuspidata NRRL YB-4993 TaxID=869754 RepID=A0A1A0H8Y8_9ASCO|nr:hypothetical protein METBIDRAFT_199473 [Metschnikowia bicuspidata var. bicuspidata NRRL YB-4993]OBA20465.1 hypothetical protein METBIDRAFT_199473 [Metschnikowia bicuspidata var. bicuspidata NRRL YB-4993]